LAQRAQLVQSAGHVGLETDDVALTYAVCDADQLLVYDLHILEELVVIICQISHADLAHEPPARHAFNIHKSGIVVGGCEVHLPLISHIWK
jgi:hypothetical protein